MPAILLPRRHYTQPQGRVEVAWDGEPLLLFRGELEGGMSAGAAAIREPGRYGISVRGTSYTTDGTLLVPSVLPFAAPGMTLVSVFDVAIPANNQFPSIAYGAPSGDFFGWWNLSLDRQVGSQTALSIRAGNSSSFLQSTGEYNTATSSDASLLAAETVVVVATWDKATLTLRVRYIGGSGDGSVSVNSASHVADWRTGAHLVRVGGYFRSSWRTYTGKIYLSAVMPGAAPASQADSLIENPWQIFRADPIRIYSLPASGDVTGTLDAVETGSDIAALVGNVAVSGTIAANEAGADVAALAGGVLVAGSLAAQESGADSAAFTGEASDTVFGTFAATEQGQDAAAMSGAVLVSGAISAQESSADTAALTGAVLVDGSLAATEAGSDTAAFAGTAAGPITGSIDAVESGSDTASFSGPIADAVAPSGGSVPSTRYKTREERDEERRRLGIIPAAPVAVVEAVKAIAVKESAKPVTPSPAKLEAQLRTDLAQAKEAYRAEYLQALIAQIELQRLQEIDRQLQEEEDEAIAMLMMALAA